MSDRMHLWKKRIGEDNMKGKVVTLEGGEGAGKTLQAKLLRDELEKKGYNVSHHKYYEPGGTKFADLLRMILKQKADTEYANAKISLLPDTKSYDLDALTQSFLFLAARRDQMKLIKEEIDNGYIVILDRSWDSTTVIQGWAQNEELVTWIRYSNELIFSDIPHIKTYVLDVPVEIALSRIDNREKGDFFDDQDKEFHERVRQGTFNEYNYYKEVKGKYNNRITVINANRPLMEVHKDLIKSVEKYLQPLQIRVCK